MRADGKRIKNADPMYTVGAYIMSKRVDSMNMITVDIPLDPIKNQDRIRPGAGKGVHKLKLFTSTESPMK